MGVPVEMILSLLVKTKHEGGDIQELLSKTPSFMLLQTLEFARENLPMVKKNKQESMDSVMKGIETHLGLDKIRVKCEITTNMEAYE